MSPIIEAMKPSPNSDRQSCASLGELFPKNGTAFATESPTTFVSSRPTIFGSSRRPGILGFIFCYFWTRVVFYGILSDVSDIRQSFRRELQEEVGRFETRT